MIERNIIGIDIAKSVFHLVVMNERSKVLNQVKLRREKVLSWLANRAGAKIGMEACGGAHYWAKVIAALNAEHEVKIIPPQFVKPYRKSQKNDFNDAEAIAEAVQKENMRFVAVKANQYLALQAVIRHRESLISRKVGIINQVHGFLLEFGFNIVKGQPGLKRVAEILEKNHELFGAPLIGILKGDLTECQRLENEIKEVEKTIVINVSADSRFKKLLEVPGIGPITAATLLVSCSEPQNYRNGRAFAASLGLVPRQFSTGGNIRLGRITKIGNKQLRSLLVLCGQSVLRSKRQDRLVQWAKEMKKGKGHNLVAVATANKLARICWHIMVQDCDYQSNMNMPPEPEKLAA